MSLAWAIAVAASTVVMTEIVPIDSLTAQIKMVEAGFGLALLPRSGVEDEVDSGRIRVLDIAEAAFSIPVALIQRRQAS